MRTDFKTDSKALLCVAASWLSIAVAHAADLTLKVVDKDPPKELNAAIRAKLQTKVIQLLDGENPAVEFWPVTEVPLQAKPASDDKALESVKQATLFGTVVISKAQKDYRDDEVVPHRQEHDPHLHRHARTLAEPEAGQDLRGLRVPGDAAEQGAEGHVFRGMCEDRRRPHAAGDCFLIAS